LKLHENKKDFFEIIEIVSQNYNLSPSIIEKDYWVTRALYLLSQNEMRDYAIFKGGTSLTKCYKDLKRFSEDIDIALLDEKLTGNALKTKIRKIEKSIIYINAITLKYSYLIIDFSDLREF